MNQMHVALEGVQGLYINERLKCALVLLTDGALVLVGRCRLMEFIFTY